MAAMDQERVSPRRFSQGGRGAAPGPEATPEDPGETPDVLESEPSGPVFRYRLSSFSASRSRSSCPTGFSTYAVAPEA